MSKKIQSSLYENLFFKALRIRMIEERIIDLYPSDLIQSPVHLSIGQEAVAVGVCNQLSINDLVFLNYRGHAFYLAKEGCIKEFFAELFGKSTGISKGKAGSMHLSYPKTGVMGASAVVASTIPHAVGAALASKIKNKDNIIVAVFGDGAVDQGVYHESLNFAALYRLPVLFLCENNGLAVHTYQKDRHSFDINQHSKAYGIKSIKVNEGYDFIKINNITSEVVNYIKKNQAPCLLEIQTFRYKEHVGPNEDFNYGYRSIDDFYDWRTKDPLFYDKKNINKYSNQIQKEIEEAVSFAKNSPDPKIIELEKDIY